MRTQEVARVSWCVSRRSCDEFSLHEIFRYNAGHPPAISPRAVNRRRIDRLPRRTNWRHTRRVWFPPCVDSMNRPRHAKFVVRTSHTADWFFGDMCIIGELHVPITRTPHRFRRGTFAGADAVVDRKLWRIYDRSSDRTTRSAIDNFVDLTKLSITERVSHPLVDESRINSSKSIAVRWSPL